jgi:hypothetical protein
MAADDEFPRGPTLSGNNIGGPLTVTFPASPGVSWALTAIDAEMMYGPSEAGPTNVAIGVTTSLGAQGPEGILGGTQPMNEYLKDTYEWTGRATGAPGVALTVTIPAAAGAYLYLTCTAEPV